MNNAITETIIPTKPNQINFIWLPTQLNKTLRVLVPTQVQNFFATQLNRFHKSSLLFSAQPNPSHIWVNDYTHSSVRVLFYPTQILS